MVPAYFFIVMMTAVVLTIALFMVLCPKTSGGALQEKDVSFKAIDGLVLQVGLLTEVTTLLTFYI